MRWLFVLFSMTTMSIWVAAASGCLAVAAAAGAGAGVAYWKGELRATVEATPPQAIAAAETALNNMEISVLSSESDALEGEIKARTAQDRRVRIRVREETDATSEVRIRIGTMGDRKMSQRIYDRIRDHL